MRDDAVFYGTLEQSFAGTMPVFGGGETKIYTFMFKVDKVLAGYSEAIGEGDTFRLVSPVDYRTGAGVYTDLTEIYEDRDRATLPGAGSVSPLDSLLRNQIFGW